MLFGVFLIVAYIDYSSVSLNSFPLMVVNNMCLIIFRCNELMIVDYYKNVFITYCQIISF